MFDYFKHHLVPALVALAFVLVAGHLLFSATQESKASENGIQSSSSTTATTSSSSSSAKSTSSGSATVNYMKPSESKAYPTLSKYNDVWIHVSIAKQRVYIMNGNTVLYTMICSSGMNNSTPTGTYYVQAQRGLHFYNASEGEGANYYTSWLNHGEFLFHTVPTDSSGNYIVSEAKKLGQPASHGCVRLTVPDAKWIYTTIPYGTKVVID